MFKLSKIQLPNKHAFVSQHLPISAQQSVASLTQVFMLDCSLFSTVGWIFSLDYFFHPLLVLICISSASNLPRMEHEYSSARAVNRNWDSLTWQSSY